MLENEISVESLVASESFQAYCLDKDPDLSWFAWVEAHPEFKLEIQEARELVLALSGQLSTEEITLQQGELRSLSQASIHTAEKHPRVVKWPVPALVGLAATILILVAVWLGGGFNTEVQMLSLSTEYGETNELVLPDGTHLTLNANSSVRYAASWENEESRQIWLDGEAFLEVTHLPSQPFIVHAGEADVKVLGTTFNVRNREKNISVLLVEGKVEVLQDEENKAILSPGDLAKLGENGLTIDSVETSQFTAWKDHRMVIRGQPIQYIVDRLAWENDIEITVSDANLLQKRVSAVLQTSDPEVLLSALVEIYGLTISKSGENTFQIE